VESLAKRSLESKVLNLLQRMLPSIFPTTIFVTVITEKSLSYKKPFIYNNFTKNASLKIACYP